LLRLLLAKFAVFFPLFLSAADFIGAIFNVNSLKAALLLPFYLCSLLPANLQQHIKINRRNTPTHV